MPDPSDLLTQLALVIAGDDQLTPPDWAHLALVAVVEAGTADLTGFCYRPGAAPLPVAPADFTLFDVLDDLRRAMAEVDAARQPGGGAGREWVSCLLRIARATGSLTADFEYDDPRRWAVTPANRLERAAELSPD